MDIFIEPVLPKPHVVILGRSPVARALARLAKTIHYSVSVFAPEADRENFPDVDLLQADLDLSQLRIAPPAFLVVSTQGEGDEEALEKAVLSNAAYVAFVASKAKARKVLDYLKERGIATERLREVRAPAGLDIRAASPEEIAVSILAEIIQMNAAGKAAPKTQAQPSVSKLEAKDPICGMMVELSAAKHRSEYQGNSFYFCCAGCKQKFDNETGGGLSRSGDR